MDTVEFTEPTSEELKVWEWRVEELTRLGFDRYDAAYLAESPDPEILASARRLIVDRGCRDFVLAREILG